MHENKPTNDGPLTPGEIGLSRSEMESARLMIQMGTLGDPPVPSPCATPIDEVMLDAHNPELSPLEADPRRTPVSHYAGDADLIGAQGPHDVALAKIEQIKRKLGAALALHVEVQQTLADPALIVQLTTDDVTSVRREAMHLADQIDALGAAVRAHEASLGATHKAAIALRAGFNVNQTGLDPMTFRRMAGTSTPHPIA